MCGRLACGLEPEQICNSCCYKPIGGNNFVRPQWKSFHNGEKTYKPSYNICPTEVAPVLLPESYSDSNLRIAAPMIFGVIPFWNKSGQSKYSTFNCRIETMTESKLYGPLLKKGQRCVVVCNGFYEWTKKNTPYFIHSEQPSGVVMDDLTTWNLEFTTENGFNGLKLLKMAALFDVQTSHKESTYSFAIITKEASTKMSWLHHRMPLFVETEEQVDAWLNIKKFDIDEALKVLSQYEKICWFSVSNIVNKTANKDIDCIKQFMEFDKKKSNKLLEWLEKKPKKENKVEEVSEKKPKVEDEVEKVPEKKPKVEDEVEEVSRS